MRPILTSAIEGILRFLLEEGDYSSLANLFALKTINIPKIYMKALTDEQDQFLITALNVYKDGFMTKAEAKVILSARMINDRSDMSELDESDIIALPENPLVDLFLNASHLEERPLIAAIDRGLSERDPAMIWTIWPMEIPFDYRNIWYLPDIWRVLLIQTFCEGRAPLKKIFFNVIKMAIDRVIFPVSEARNQLLVLNISLFVFYLEVLRILRVLKETNRSRCGYAAEIEELKRFALLNFNAISLNRARLDQEIFDGLDAKSAQNLHSLPDKLLSNSFYYENRVELFARILERLETIPDLFADWFSNLYAAFLDVIGKMSLALLLKSWRIYLRFNPSIESLCTIISWFHGRIKEDFRFKLAKQIPDELLLEFYRTCNLKFLPRPLELIPYSMRKTEYLRKARGGTSESYSYGFENFWKTKNSPITKILVLFEYMSSKRVDLFETIDMRFDLDPNSGGDVGIRRFIELVLGEFLHIKEWYIPMTADAKEIIPSPLFPPVFAPFLVQFIVRCRHLSCAAPFKISEKYLTMAFCGKYCFSREYLSKFIKSQINYLTRSEGRCLPRLTQTYHLYFGHLQMIQQNLVSDFIYINYLNLQKTAKRLWESAENPTAWDLSPNHLEQMEEKIHEVVSKTLELFSRELYTLLGPVTFSTTEVFKFLYK